MPNPPTRCPNPAYRIYRRQFYINFRKVTFFIEWIRRNKMMWADETMMLVLEWPRVRESLPDSRLKATITATLATCWTIYFAVTTTASGQTLAGPRLPLRSISWYAAWVPFPKWIWSVILFLHLARDIHARQTLLSTWLPKSENRSGDRSSDWRLVIHNIKNNFVKILHFFLDKG